MNAEEIQQVAAQLRPGARRKRIKMAQTTVMMDTGERAALDEVAEETGRSRSELIREAVRRVWLKKGRKV